MYIRYLGDRVVRIPVNNPVTQAAKIIKQTIVNEINNALVTNIQKHVEHVQNMMENYTIYIGSVLHSQPYQITSSSIIY